MADTFFVLARFWLRPGNFEEFERLSAEEIWPGFERLGPRVRGLYRARESDPHPAVDGPSEMAVMVIEYASEGHWRHSLEQARRREGAVDRIEQRMQEAFARRAAITVASSLLPMDPAPVDVLVPYFLEE